ncbi:unnamed protein product [Peniophora sp. CBMAI 1063]|nr:unnamed protein product [Peniophora sp. CBMAI 1063]
MNDMNENWNATVSTLADALSLRQPSVDVDFLAHLVPIKEANFVLRHAPKERFVTYPLVLQPWIINFDADGKTKCVFTWNGAQSFKEAKFTVTSCSSANIMVNDEQLVQGMPVDLDDCDTIQLFEHAKADYPRIDVKFFYRLKHALCSKRTLRTYMVLSRAGQGGYGTVQKCRNPVGEQRLAVKRTKAGPLLANSTTEYAESKEVANLEYIWAQVKAMNAQKYPGQIDIDPHIVMLRDHWVKDTFQFIVMDMALGDLHSLVKKKDDIGGRARLDELEVLSIARQVFMGLNFMHYLGYVHCDIKPANILLYGRREGAMDPYSHVVLGDLGISKTETDLELMAARGEAFIGTPGFLPPEVAITTLIYSKAVDIWAAGISLYYACTGNYLYRGASAEQVQARVDSGRHISTLAQLNISKAAVEFICRCLQPNHLFRPTADQALLDPWVSPIPQLGDHLFTPANAGIALPVLDYPANFSTLPLVPQAGPSHQAAKHTLGDDVAQEGQGAQKRMRVDEPLIEAGGAVAAGGLQR